MAAIRSPNARDSVSDGARSAPRVGRWDNLRFNAMQIVPQLLRGMFVRRRRLSSVLDRIHPDPQGVRLVTELRSRYGSDYLWLGLAGKPSLLVLDPDGIRGILDASPDVYGPPDIKVRGMSHFQPGAVTISKGDQWRQRRAFNDEVLEPVEPPHPNADLFLDIVEREVSRLLAGNGPRTVTWSELHGAFRRITAAVVFGPEVDAEDVLDGLDELMARANRIVGSTDTEELHDFQEAIRGRVCAPDAGGLSAAACPHLEPGDPLPVSGQIPHWLFAMKDTLATNCAYALALVAAHGEAQQRARAEAASADLADPVSVDGLHHLEGCLREAMRLWPTTPMIVRKAMRDAELGHHSVPEGSQVVIHNGFNHRRPDAMVDPDGFHPEAREAGVWDYRFNPMSNGPQACAGRELALFLGKAVLARLLETRRWTLEAPELDAGRAVPHAFDLGAMRVRGTPSR